MPASEDIMNSLDKILVPGVMRSLGKMNLVRDINIQDAKINITYYSKKTLLSS